MKSSYNSFPVTGTAYALFAVTVFVFLTYVSVKCWKRQAAAAAVVTANDSDDSDMPRVGIGQSGISVGFDRMKVHEIDGGGGGGCVICLADYEKSDEVRVLRDCGHLFHTHCVDPWLSAHATCPVCRRTPAAALTPAYAPPAGPR